LPERRFPPPWTVEDAMASIRWSRPSISFCRTRRRSFAARSCGAEIFEHRLDDRRIGAAGQLAAFGVEQRDPVVVLVADHRRARCALDRGLDLELGGNSAWLSFSKRWREERKSHSRAY
jgi:hypothetical protein